MAFWFRVISDFLTIHFTDDLGSVLTPTSLWSIDCSKNETTDQMRCFVSHRHFNGLTCLEVTGLTTVDVSISHITVVGRTKLKCPSHLRYSPFPSASHLSLFVFQFKFRHVLKTPYLMENRASKPVRKSARDKEIRQPVPNLV
jgi:hypothetical protein